jgi:hypothetical protein
LLAVPEFHYKQACSPGVRWAVVENPAMVERASELSTEYLQFFASISNAATPEPELTLPFTRHGVIHQLRFTDSPMSSA